MTASTSPDPAPLSKKALATGTGRKYEKKLYTKDWLEIISLAESGVRLEEIAKTYNVARGTVYAGLLKRRINLKNIALRVQAEEDDRTKTDLLKKIRETKDKDFRYVEALQGQVMTVVMTAVKEKTAVGRHIDDIKALKIAIDAISRGTQNKWMLLGLDRENKEADTVLPELPIRDMTEREVTEIRNKQIEEDGGELLDEEIAAEIDRAMREDEELAASVVEEDAS